MTTVGKGLEYSLTRIWTKKKTWNRINTARVTRTFNSSRRIKNDVLGHFLSGRLSAGFVVITSLLVGLTLALSMYGQNLKNGICYVPQFEWSTNDSLVYTQGATGKSMLRQHYLHFMDESTCSNFHVIESTSLKKSSRWRPQSDDRWNVLILDFHGDSVDGDPAKSVGMNREFYQMLTDKGIFGDFFNVRILPRAEKDAIGLVQKTYLPCPVGKDRELYYIEVSKQKWIDWADMIAISVPMVTSQMLMPFNKPLILWITTPLDHGRQSLKAFRQWRDDFRLLAKSSRVAMISASQYDQMYAKHFYNVDTRVIQLLSEIEESESLAVKKEGKKSVGLIPRDSWNHPFWDQNANVLRTKSSSNISLEKIEDYSYLNQYDALVYIPYQKNTNLFIEAFRMNIPIFTPSLKYLSILDIQNCQMSNRAYWKNPPEPCCAKYRYSPTDMRYFQLDSVPESHLFWLEYSEQFHSTYKEVIQFDGIEDLLKKLENLKFEEIANQMRDRNAKYKNVYRSEWKSVLGNLLHRSNTLKEGRNKNLSYQNAMLEYWNLDSRTFRDDNVCFTSENVWGIPKRLTCDEWLPFPY